MSEVIVAAALASKGANLAPLKAISEYIAKGDAIHYVDGALLQEDQYVASSPTWQANEISQLVELQPEKKFIVLSQSMGALAALATVEKYENTRAISIAPPLLYPSDLIRHPRLLSRLKNIDNTLYMPSASYALGESGPSDTPPKPIDIVFPDSLMDDIDEISDDYFDRTQAAVHRGALNVVMPTDDWNVAGLEAARYLSKVQYVKGPHSLHTDAETLEQNIQIIGSLAE